MLLPNPGDLGFAVLAPAVHYVVRAYLVSEPVYEQLPAVVAVRVLSRMPRHVADIAVKHSLRSRDLHGFFKGFNRGRRKVLELVLRVEP